jgi:hypothetical protein
MESNELDRKKSKMKSMKIKDHGEIRIDNGWKNP